MKNLYNLLLDFLEKEVIFVRILVIEDDHLLNQTICYNLIRIGYFVDSAYTKEDAQVWLMKKKYDLAVLDVNLPDGDGFELCSKIKEQQPHIAIVFLTARDMEIDQIKGYKLGADDYITKPFHLNIFQHKIQAILSRVKKHNEDDCFDDGNLKIDFSEMTATLAGEVILFTPLEYRLLKELIKNSPMVMTRSSLLENLWAIDGNFVDEHALTSAISRIRTKIETNNIQYLKTVYGMGYIWVGGVKR